MSLADSLSPECVISSVWKYCIRIRSLNREHSRIPSYGYNSDMSALFCRLVNCGKMLRNPCVRIKAVDNVEHRGILRSLLGKIGGRSAAKHKNVDLILPFVYIPNRHYRNIPCPDLYRIRIPARKYRRKLHIFCVSYRNLYTSSQVSVSQYTDPNAHL